MSSIGQFGQQSVELVDMPAEHVHPAKGVRDRAERGGRIAVESAETPLEALQLAVQDERAGSTLVCQLAELGLGDRALGIRQHVVQPDAEIAVELQPG